MIFVFQLGGRRWFNELFWLGDAEAMVVSRCCFLVGMRDGNEE